MRNGDLSASARNIYDPATGGVNGVNREQFANNVIPSTRFDPVAKTVADLYPAPNIQGLDNQHYDYIIPIDEPATEANLDIRISKRYAVQLDFDWLWDSDRENRTDYATTDEDPIPQLVPWMLCKYRF